MPTKTTTTRRRAAKSAAPARPSGNHTPARHLRIPDELWDPAGESAKAAGYTGASELVRELLRDYVAGKRMK